MLASCTNLAPEPIMTDEKFDSRVVENGTHEFVYGISWRNTSQSSLLSNNERQEEPAPSRRGERERYEEQRTRFAVQADNKTKLELEDKAADGLDRRLRKEKLCANGHQIDDVVWLADNIRLLGHCL